MHKSNQAFGQWCKEHGFDDIPSGDRLDAMWFASSPPGNTIPVGMTHPKHIRQWAREQKTTAILPADLADIQAETTESVELDERSAEKVAKLARRARMIQTVRNIINFDFNNSNLRVIELNGQPWFVAPDVCKTLGFNMRAGAAPHLLRLDASERQLLKASDLPKSALGRAPNVSIVSESGLYKLIMRSDKPEAKVFQDWVTKVVLPAIHCFISHG